MEGKPKPASLKIPEHFVAMVKSWENLENFEVTVDIHLIDLALDFFNEKLQSLTPTQMKHFNEECVKKLNKWAKDGIIHKDSRGFPRR